MQVFVMVVIGIGLFGMGLCVVMLIRNEIVYKVRTQVLEEVSAAAQAAISTGDDWKAAYAPYEQLPSYGRMMWQFGKWTRKQFCR